MNENNKLADHIPDATKMVAERQDKPEECANGCPENMVCDYCQGAEPVKQEPVACQDSDDRRLLREIFMLCEATEELEPTNDFMRGRVFEAKGIRRGIGTWYQDTFCGRSYMGEPVIPATPVQPVKQEPVARVTGYYGGRCVIELLNRASVFPTNMALYAAPVQPVKQEPVEWFHKVGCRANAFGECDMGCQPPVDAKAIRAEALEEAAKWLAESGLIGSNDCAAAIRGLK